MNSIFLQFIKKSSLLTLVILILGLTAFLTFATQWYSHVFPFLLLFFYLLSLAIQKYLYKIITMSMLKFSARFMAVTMLKLIVLLIVALIYVLLNKEEAIAFIAVFFVLYVAFSAIEIHDIMQVSEKK